MGWEETQDANLFGFTSLFPCFSDSHPYLRKVNMCMCLQTSKLNIVWYIYISGQEIMLKSPKMGFKISQSRFLFQIIAELESNLNLSGAFHQICPPFCFLTLSPLCILKSDLTLACQKDLFLPCNPLHTESRQAGLECVPERLNYCP